MNKRDEIIWSFEYCRKNPQSDACASCEYDGRSFQVCEQLADDVLALLKAEEPRVMALEEVIAQEHGTVLWVEESQNYVWNMFPLVVDLISKHPDTGTFYLFFIAYHDLKKFEGEEYGLTWRCWTSRPTDAQRKAVKWE